MTDFLPARSETTVPSAFGTRDLVYIVFRRRRWILAVWLPVFLVGLMFLFRQTGGYVAGSQVLLELQAPQNPSFYVSNRLVDYDLSISTYSNLAMSVPVAEMAAKTLSDSVAVLVAADPELAGIEKHERMLEFILDNLDVSRVAESNLLEIRYQAAHPAVALVVNRAVRDAFLEYGLRAGKNERAISYFEEQVRKTEAEIDSLLQLREQVSLDTGVAYINQDSRNMTGLLADLEVKFYESGAAAGFQEQRVAHLRRTLADNPDFVPIGEAAGLDRLRARLEEEQHNYYKILASHPESSQVARRQATLVEDLRSQARAAVQDFIESKELEGRTFRGKADVLREQMDEVTASLSTLPNAYRRITLLDARIRAKTELLQDMQIKSGEVTLNEMADDRVSRLTKITEPEIIRVISETRKFAIFGVLAVFGFALALVVATLVDSADHRINDPNALLRTVKVPVLGSISDAKR
ncbi:MAG: hypothetical protein R6X25_09255 [Candidatus Krumholzibacteriia bacterium]